MTSVAEPIRSRRVGARITSFAVPIGLVLVLVPLVVSAVIVLAHAPATPIRDHALMEMRVRDIGLHPVLLGLYSRDGWSHPGPLVFLTLAIPYRIFGSSTSGMVVGALAVNAGSIAGMVAIGRRLGGRRGALTLLVALSVLLRAMGPELLRNPWVLFITVLPFGLFCCVVWALVMGRRWALPASVAVASWLVQTHVGFAPMTVPLVIGGAVVLAFVTRRTPDSPAKVRIGPALLWSIAVVVVAWPLPVWDQLFRTGNLETTARWFSDAREGVHTLTEGTRVVLGQFAVPPDWLTGTRRISPFDGETLLRTQWLWPVLLAPFALAAVVAWRRRDAAVLRLAAVVGVTAVLGIVAVARTIGVMYEYRILWTWVLGMLAAAVVGWTLWNEVRRRWPGCDGWITVVALVTVATLSVVQILDVNDGPKSDWDSPSLREVVQRLIPTLRREGAGQVVLTSETPDGEWFLQGLVLDLEKRGFDARVLGLGGGLYPDHLVVGSGPVRTRLLVLAGSDINKLGFARARRVIAYGGPLPLRQEIAMLRAHDKKAQRLLDQFAAGAITRLEYARAAERLTITTPAAIAILRA